MNDDKKQELELSWEIEKCLNNRIRVNGWNKMPNDMAIYSDAISDEIAAELYKLGYRKRTGLEEE